MLHRTAVEPSTLELLRAVNRLPQLRQFALTGGTNLALRYGHRMSADLDFFTPFPFDTQAIIQLIQSEFASSLLLEEAANTISLVVSGVKVDFIAHQYPTLPFEVFDGIRFFALQDVIAMKLGAIARRGAKKDFWDLAELTRHFSVAEMLAFYGTKYQSTDPFFVIRSLTYFSDAESQENLLSLTDLSWEQVKGKVEQAVSTFLRGKLAS